MFQSASLYFPTYHRFQLSVDKIRVNKHARIGCKRDKFCLQSFEVCIERCSRKFPYNSGKTGHRRLFPEIDPINLLKYVSQILSNYRAKVSTVCLTAAKLKLQRICFPVMCPHLEENDGIFP